MKRRLGAGLLIIAAAVWWWSSSEASASPASDVFVPGSPAETPASVEALLDAAAAGDSGFIGEADARVPDAGFAESPDELWPPEVQAYVDRWKLALAPLLNEKRRRVAPSVLLAPDAGFASCQPEIDVLIAERPLPVDLLVAVDTSGSMKGPGLEQVALFLGLLEHQLTMSRVDVRLLVLAAPGGIDLPTDAGRVGHTINSNDGLEVILRTARDQVSWLDALRPGVELRIALATDDEALELTELNQVQMRMAELLADRPYSFSVLGGFTATSALLPTDRTNNQVCSSARALGVSPGLLYQQLAIATGGLRGSLCSDDSVLELATRLATPTRQAGRCHVEVQAGGRLTIVALTERNDEYSLLEEPVSSQCSGLRRSYTREGRLISLCPDTCGELKMLGANRLRVRLECPSP